MRVTFLSSNFLFRWDFFFFKEKAQPVWWGSINQVLTLYRDGVSRLLHDLLSE